MYRDHEQEPSYNQRAALHAAEESPRQYADHDHTLPCRPLRSMLISPCAANAIRDFFKNDDERLFMVQPRAHAGWSLRWLLTWLLNHKRTMKLFTQQCHYLRP